MATDLNVNCKIIKLFLKRRKSSRRGIRVLKFDTKSMLYKRKNQEFRPHQS